jgi:hypothetical protein
MCEAPVREGRVTVVITAPIHRVVWACVDPVSCQSTLLDISPRPRRDDLANHWDHGPFARSFILLMDPGDICPPQAPDLWVDFEITGPKILGLACSL